MKDKDSDSEAPAEDVQAYLDLLLSRATETPSSAVEPSSPGRVDSSAARPRLSLVVEAERKPLAEAVRPAVVLPIAPLSPAPPVTPPKPATPAPDTAEPPVEVVAPAAVDRGPETLLDTTPATVTDAAQEADTAAPDEPTALASEWLANGRPVWAQQPFQCLLFEVGGLTLAVPLVALGSIVPISDELTPLFGQIEWFMGLLPGARGNLRVVDTAQVVMPERYHTEMQQQYQYVISIAGVDWGLAVDRVAEAITLPPEAVKWRSQRSTRPWLAGTVVEHMCALVDPGQLADMLASHARA